MSGSSVRPVSECTHASGLSGNTSAKWRNMGGTASIATTSPQKNTQSSVSSRPLYENAITPKNATDSQKKCSVA